MEASIDRSKKILKACVPRPFDIWYFDLGVLPQGEGESGGKMPPREANDE
jgi:hypothetical protein